MRFDIKHRATGGRLTFTQRQGQLSVLWSVGLKQSENLTNSSAQCRLSETFR